MNLNLWNQWSSMLTFKLSKITGFINIFFLTNFWGKDPFFHNVKLLAGAGESWFGSETFLSLDNADVVFPVLDIDDKFILGTRLRWSKVRFAVRPIKPLYATWTIPYLAKPCKPMLAKLPVKSPSKSTRHAASSNFVQKVFMTVV